MSITGATDCHAAQRTKTHCLNLLREKEERNRVLPVTSSDIALRAEPLFYRITIKAEGKGPPAIVRIRRLLKFILRGFGLRCVEVKELNEEP